MKTLTRKNSDDPLMPGGTEIVVEDADAATILAEHPGEWKEKEEE